MDFHMVHGSPSLNSPRGVPESNGRAVISALRTLQSKIREMELKKGGNGGVTPNRIQSPRSVQSNSIETDSESTTFHRATVRMASPRLMTSPRVTSPRVTTPRVTSPRVTSPRVTSPRLYSPRLSYSSKGYERSAELEAELSQADERCKVLEEKLSDMRMAFVRAETERNKETEARIRSERERIAAVYSAANSPFGSPRADIVPTHDLPLPKLNLNQVEKPTDEEEEDLQLDEINIRYRSSSTDQRKETFTPSPPSSSYKVNLRNIPFCAGKSTQPSHNVGLNIQGLLHQIKTTRTNRTVRKSQIPSSETDSDAAENRNLTSDIANLEELLADLQREFGEITLSCRETSVKVETLQKRLVQLEKKGQQILVVKKLLKKKHKEMLEPPVHTVSRRHQSKHSQRSAGPRSAQNRVLLREVKKVTNAMTSDDMSWNR